MKNRNLSIDCFKGEKMISDKVLILFPYEININNGGPSGFLAHNLLDKPRDCFVLSQDIIKTHPEKITKKIDYIIKRILFLWKNRGKDKRKLKEEFFYKYYFEKLEAKNYKYIFFHETIHFERFRKYISENQVIILQSHSPEIPSVEYRNWAPLNTEEISFREKAEKEAFKRADIIVFPNEGCVSIYETLITDRSKIKYILSGAKKDYNNDGKNSYELPEDKINLMYIGRRNKIKGFDIVLETFRKAREKRKDINLVIIGNGEKINEEGITDIGFSKNPIGWYNSADYLINANRQSYFDLSLIEALITGIPIIMADNFGHGYYKGKSSLIKTFDVDSPDELYEILTGNLEKRDYRKTENMELYEKNLTDGCYYERFKKFVREIIDTEG